MDQLIIGLAVTIIRILADQNAALRQANPEEGVNRGLLGALFGLVVARPGTFVMRPIRIVGRGLGWFIWLAYRCGSRRATDPECGRYPMFSNNTRPSNLS